MKKWIATHTHDYENFETKEIEAENYVMAIVAFELKYPNEMISDLKEKKD